jgi:hypothetical protein
VNLRVALLVLCTSAPSQAQAPQLDAPLGGHMLVSHEERARINKEFADLFDRTEQAERKLYECQSVQRADWKGWW